MLCSCCCKFLYINIHNPISIEIKKKINRKFQDTRSKLTMFQNWLKLFAFSPIRKWNGHSMWQWTINTLTNDTPHNVSTLLITRVKYSFTFIFSKVSLILILISREEISFAQLSCATFKFIMTHYERERDTRSFLYSMRISRMRIIDKREEDAVLDQTKASRRATELKPSLWLNSLLLCIGKKVHRVQTIPGRRKYSILAHFLSPIRPRALNLL